MYPQIEMKMVKDGIYAEVTFPFFDPVKDMQPYGFIDANYKRIIKGTSKEVYTRAARVASKQSKSPKKQDEASNLNREERYISRKSKFKSMLLDKNFEVENPKKLEELSDKNCRWPIGHPDEENFYFCGRNPVEGFSYCKLHVLYAFQPKNQKEELIDKEDDVPAFLEKKIKVAK